MESPKWREGCFSLLRAEALDPSQAQELGDPPRPVRSAAERDRGLGGKARVACWDPQLWALGSGPAPAPAPDQPLRLGLCRALGSSRPFSVPPSRWELGRKARAPHLWGGVTAAPLGSLHSPEVARPAFLPQAT